MFALIFGFSLAVDQPCELCAVIIANIQMLIDMGYPEEEIAKAVLEQCSVWTEPFKSACEGLGTKYLNYIIKLIKEGKGAKDICDQLGFCIESQKLNARIAAPAPIDDSFVCDMCQQLVKYIEELVASQMVEEEIETLVLKLCDKFNAPYNTLCATLVKQYVPTICQWIDQGIETLEICKKIKLCKKTEQVARLAIPAGAEDSFVCDMCQQLVKYIEELVASQMVEEEIETLVLKLCDKFNAPYNTLCATLVKQYVPTICQWIDQGIETLEICKKIKLCKKTNVAARLVTDKKAISCDVCVSFFKWAEGELEKYSIEGLWYLVNTKCPNVPYLKYFCQIINEQNIQTFVDLLISHIAPVKACTWIKICK